MKIALIILIFATLIFVGCTSPRGWPGIQIAEDTIYVGTLDGRILALNPDSGSRKWEWTPASGQSSNFLGCGCTGGGQLAGGLFYDSPVIAYDSVYIGTYSGKIYAINTENGVEKWEYNVGSAIVGGVTVANNTLFVGSSNGQLHVLNLANDTAGERFTFKTENKIWSTPVVQNGIVYFGSLDHNLYALDASTGEKKWSFKTDASITATPLVMDELLYIGSHDSKLYAINTETGEMKWVFDKAGDWFWSKVVYDSGTIYAGSLDHYIYAVGAGNGTLLWSFETSGPINTSPIIAGGVLIVASEEGKVYGLDLSTGEKKWQFDDIKAKVLTSPCTDGNTVYIDADDNLYALDGKTGHQAWKIPLGK